MRQNCKRKRRGRGLATMPRRVQWLHHQRKPDRWAALTLDPQRRGFLKQVVGEMIEEGLYAKSTRWQKCVPWLKRALDESKPRAVLVNA